MFLSLIVFIAHHFTTTFFPLEIYTPFRAGFARRVFKRKMILQNIQGAFSSEKSKTTHFACKDKQKR
jgi:hypothetical protein